MSTFRRVFIAIGAPVVVIGGLAVMWGWRNASLMKAQVEAWADSLQHSAHPVTMHMPFIPVYVAGARVGKLQTLVIERQAPGTVDSVRVEIAVGPEADMALLADCRLKFDPDAFDQQGPMGFKHALECAADTTGLVRFGRVMLTGTGKEVTLFLDSSNVPCEHLGDPQAAGCTDMQVRVDELKQRLRDEIRINVNPTRPRVRVRVP